MIFHVVVSVNLKLAPVPSWISERPVECHKTKTKVTDNPVNQSKLEFHTADEKHGKTRASEPRFVLVLLLLDEVAQISSTQSWHSNENRSDVNGDIVR